VKSTVLLGTHVCLSLYRKTLHLECVSFQDA